MLFRAAILSLFLLMAFHLVSCGERKSSEEEIREYFTAIEKHMENRNTGRLKKYISDGYTDKYKYSKRDLIRIAAGYLLRHQAIHLRQNIVAMDINDEKTKANITIDVAVSQEPMSEQDIRMLQGDFHRFEVILDKEGDWLLKSLRWQRITADDFISGVGKLPPAKD